MVFAATALGGPSTTFAQSEGFTADRFVIAPSLQDGLALQLPTTLGHLGWSANVGFGYAGSPLASKLMTAPDGEFEVVSGRATGQFAFALGLFESLQLNAVLGADFSQSGDDASEFGLDLPMPESSGLSDLSIGGTYHFFGAPSAKANLAANVALSIPTGSQDAFTGDGGFGASGSLSGAYVLPSFTLAAQAGVAYRPERNFALLQTGSELFARGGAYVPLGQRVRLLAEIDSRTDLHEDRILTRGGTPVEGLLGARVSIFDGLHAGVLGGLGLMNASGESNGRILFTLGWAQLQKTDRLVVAAAPAEAPPAAPVDDDGDGIANAQDQCPQKPEDIDNHQDDDGCPDPDNDGDGIADGDDQCPMEAEDMDGIEDADGCPDTDPAPAVVEDPPKPTKLTADEAKQAMPGSINFDVGNADVRTEVQSTLDALADFLEAHPEIQLIEIRGHASEEGTTKYNLKLSIRRAEAARSYLVAKGVDESRIRIHGAGESEPIAKGNNEASRRQNRRIEIKVLRVE